ncbi:hypothetical protein C4B68_09580 [Streptomyces dengpaensis]|uniref:Helix-turn-helix domain-containing protein n=1 Tax=Streptomyces dengpaensis TaxID=2049881 RepID=A0ABM6SNR3_9ACTN|nr:hypothetical protein C4B68_09580 [Streptomyces dengpaensis]PIB12229.1 hypothetical protein B1C81_03515 [Streptomyces sp. HG99]
MCGGARCERRAAEGRPRRLAVRGHRLCPGCRDRLVAELRRLPRLYEECGRLLGGSDRARERTSGGPLPGLPFNTAASDARSAITGVLRSWSSVVVDERRTSPPPTSVEALAAFLARHCDWLTTHQAAAELSRETATLVRDAHRVVDPSPLRRVPIGPCVEADCRGVLVALVRPHRSEVPVEIRCDAAHDHRWSADEWLSLSRLLARETRVRWIGAADIARLWDIAPGSVYRHASERRWRRRAEAGRTYYHAEDVQRSLGARARNRAESPDGASSRSAT